MKNRKRYFNNKLLRAFVLFLCVMTIRPDAAAQSGVSCDSAIILGSGTSCSTRQTSLNSCWFRFTAAQAHVSLRITSSTDIAFGHAHRVEVYSGSCATPVLLAANQISAPGDTVLEIDTAVFTPGQDYYVQVITGGVSGCQPCLHPATFTICKYDGALPQPLNTSIFGTTMYFEDCNLNYCLTSVSLHQRASPLTPLGQAQPCGLNVTCLPPGAQVIAARFYFVTVGSATPVINVFLVDPAGNFSVVPAGFTANGNGTTNADATCWGLGYNNTTSAYVANFTAAVAANGNGLYTFAGLPNQTGNPAPNKNDADGATLLIIYKVPCEVNSRKGKIWLRDGLGVLDGGTAQNYTIGGTSYASNVNCRFFAALGDVEDQVPNNLTTINGVGIAGNFWNAVDVPVAMNANLNNVVFQHGNNFIDCSAVPFYGFYMQDGTQYCGPPAVVDAGPDQTICTGGNSSVVLNGTISGGPPLPLYTWTPATGLSSPLVLNPAASPTVTTTYTLTVTDYYGCTRTDEVTVFVGGPPTAEISGPEFPNCNGSYEFGFENNVCDPNVTYTWTFADANGNTSSYTGCPVSINVPATGGTAYLLATDNETGCTARDTFLVPPCCDAGQGLIYVNDLDVPALIALPGVAVHYNAATQTISNVQNFVINGVLTVNAGITFYNCDFGMGANARIEVLPSKTLTFDDCRIDSKCLVMWDGIYIRDNSATLNIINNSVMRYARNCVVSQKGGAFYIRDSRLEDNYRHVVVQPWNGTLPCDVQNSTFTYTGAFITAIPPLPATAVKPDVAFEINQVQNITIGNSSSPGARNTIELCDFGIRADRSNVTVLNNLFRNIQPNPLVNFSGVCIYDHAKKLTPVSLVIGGANANEPNTFQRYSAGVDAYNYVNVDARKNVFDNGASNSGQFGIGAFTCAGRTVHLENNTFIRHKTAIWINECLNADVDIRANTIDAPAFGSNGTGIQVEAVLLQPITLNIHQNTISRTRTGIWTNTITGTAAQPGPSIRYNNVLMNFPDASVIGFGRHYGIRVTNCYSVDAEVNYVNRITIPVPNVDTLLRGIHVEYSTGTTVNSNTFRHMSEGIWMEQSDPGSQLTCNVMDSCWNGVLLNNATIGDQYAFLPNDNLFAVNPAGPNSINSDIKGVIPVNTSWFYRNTAFNTIPSQAVSGPGAFNLVLNNSSNSGCSSVPPALARDSKYSTPIENEQMIKQNDPDYNWWNSRNTYQHFHRYTQELTMNTTDDTLYQHFYSRISSESIAQTGAVADSLTNGNLAAAIVLNSTLPTGITQDDLRKTVNNIYLSTWAVENRVLTPADSATLYTIAFGNPATWGDAVFSARVMLGIDPSATFGSRLGAPEEEPGTTQAMNADMFPQPASDQATLVFPVTENENASLIFFTIVGQQIKSVSLSEGSNHSFSITDLPSGVYLYRVVIDGQYRKTDRFVIMK